MKREQVYIREVKITRIEAKKAYVPLFISFLLSMYVCVMLFLLPATKQYLCHTLARVYTEDTHVSFDNKQMQIKWQKKNFC